MKTFSSILLLTLASAASLPALALPDPKEIVLDPPCRYYPVKGEAPCGGPDDAFPF